MQAIQTKAASGTPVTLTGVEHNGLAMVHVQFIHPSIGEIEFNSDSFGEAGKKGSPKGIIGFARGNRVCVTVPKADFDTAMTDARSIGEREIEAFKNGEKTIRLHYHDGEYLSGHTVAVRPGQLLRELGLAKEVNGWGLYVEPNLVTALGEEFTYSQAEAFAQPAIDAAKAKAETSQREREAKFAEAKTTGQKVEMARWNEGCCEKDFDCSLDIVTEYAMPNGTTKIERIHTH